VVKAHPAVPAGSYGATVSNETVEAFGKLVAIYGEQRECAGRNAGVNAEQASKMSMRRSDPDPIGEDLHAGYCDRTIKRLY